MARLPDDATDEQAAVWFHAELVTWCANVGVQGMNRSVAFQLEAIQGWITEGLMGVLDPIEEASA